MRYYKKVSDGYIQAIGTGFGGEEISKVEYDSIMSVVKTVEHSHDKCYRLKEDLSWELYELPIVEEDEEATAEDYQNALAEMGVKV